MSRTISVAGTINTSVVGVKIAQPGPKEEVCKNWYTPRSIQALWL